MESKDKPDLEYQCKGRIQGDTGGDRDFISKRWLEIRGLQFLVQELFTLSYLYNNKLCLWPEGLVRYPVAL